ncbi:Na(+)/H(+) antiporter NhaA 2 [Diplonema papillatum]|nr:Na(+)/H(+) antiporter NhaA 2 [Diplonema papillatum]|eukprot:gene11764-18142_t
MARVAGFLALCLASASGQLPIPENLQTLGYILGNEPATRKVEVFGDFQCPDTLNDWEAKIKPLLAYIKANNLPVSFTYHSFPLPYHLHAWRSAMAVEEAVQLLMRGGNTSRAAAFEVVATAFFRNQFQFQNNVTATLDQRQVWNGIFWPIASGAGVAQKYQEEFGQAVNSSVLDSNLRIEWKYGCSRTISGTPIYALNNVISYDVAAWSLQQWEAWVAAAPALSPSQ